MRSGSERKPYFRSFVIWNIACLLMLVWILSFVMLLVLSYTSIEMKFVEGESGRRIVASWFALGAATGMTEMYFRKNALTHLDNSAKL